MHSSNEPQFCFTCFIFGFVLLCLCAILTLCIVNLACFCCCCCYKCLRVGLPLMLASALRFTQTKSITLAPRLIFIFISLCACCCCRFYSNINIANRDFNHSQLNWFWWKRNWFERIFFLQKMFFNLYSWAKPRWICMTIVIVQIYLHFFLLQSQQCAQFVEREF